jgi:hypothetical protein
VRLADNPPVPANLVQQIERQVQAGAPAVEVVSQAVQAYGPLAPNMAREVARNTHVRVPGSDNRMHDDRPLEMVERDSDRIQRQMGLCQALKHIATQMLPPVDEIATIPSYQYSATVEHLDMAVQWLLDFRSEWRKAHG